jgi:hypothetical protein
MGRSTHTEDWFQDAFDRADTALQGIRGVGEYREKDPAVYQAYLLQRYATECLTNGETNPRTCARMIQFDGRNTDSELGMPPVQFFKKQWNTALDFCRTQLFEAVCHRYFGGIVDGRGTSAGVLALRNAMEKSDTTCKFTYEAEPVICKPHEVFEKLDFGVVSEEDYAEAAEVYREKLGVYTKLRSKRMPQLTDEVLGSVNFGWDFDDDDEAAE